MSPYGGGSKGSRNSSTGRNSGARQYGANVANGVNRPTPSYMKPTGGPRVARSNERSGSYQKRQSPAAPAGGRVGVPSGYRPPHMRNNFVGGANRASPGAGNRLTGATGAQK